MEKECVSLMLRGTIPVDKCPARRLGRVCIPFGLKGQGVEGRLQLTSSFNNYGRRATKSIAAKSNGYVAGIADRILVAHAERGCKTERLCKDEIARCKRVFTLDSTDNAHLTELGAVPIPADDPKSLLLA